MSASVPKGKSSCIYGADLTCGVSYGDDLQLVRDVALRAIEEAVDYNKEKPVELFYTEFGNSSINFTLRFWLNNTAQKAYLQAQSEAIMALKKAFDENDITIPFPIRTLDFGIKGSENLKKMLSGEEKAEQKWGQKKSPNKVGTGINKHYEQHLDL